MTTIIKEQHIIMEEISRLVSEGKTVTILAKGYSMNPFIRHMQDQITLGPWKDSDIRKGQVALVKDKKGSFLLHRIIKRDGNLITLMGDGNIGITETADVNDVIGIMVNVIKKGRTYSVKGLRWRLYSWFWNLLRPVRRYPLALWRRLNPQSPLK